MKKKAIAALAVLLVALTAVSAAPVFSGRFRQGYTFKFAADGTTSSAWKSEESKVVMKFSDENGVWTVNLKGTGALDSNDKWSANGSVNLTKILSGAGVDTGDFTAAISLGANTKMTALSVYNDVTGSEYYKLKNNGKESMQIATAYGKYVGFNVAFDPTSDGKSAVVSAKVAPVNGLSFTAAYAYNGYYDDAVSGADITSKNIVGGSLNVDFAKLFDADFALGLAVYDNYAVEAKYNSFAATVFGGVDAVDAFAELVMVNKEAGNTLGINTQVNLNVVDNL
ncbi:MAG: hypothetical protein SPJ34_03650, partial [Candidatus Ornithospirochaeta sp.]|nr:hypothetical protein [Candidatus Ornithospirochaeta sp.]